MSLKKRLEKLENQIRPEREPVFHYWLDHPWTDEEKAEAMRKFPDRKIFFKRLSEVTPTEGDHLQ